MLAITPALIPIPLLVPQRAYPPRWAKRSSNRQLWPLFLCQQTTQEIHRLFPRDLIIQIQPSPCSIWVGWKKRWYAVIRRILWCPSCPCLVFWSVCNHPHKMRRKVPCPSMHPAHCARRVLKPQSARHPRPVHGDPWVRMQTASVKSAPVPRWGTAPAPSHLMKAWGAHQADHPSPVSRSRPPGTC